MRTLVVVPTYKEVATVETVLRRLRHVVPSATVLVVDDNSPDGTAEVADAMAQELGGIEVMRRPHKAGLGTAYRSAFRWGLERGYEALVEMDGDLSHDPAALPGLLAAKQAGVDLVVGSRYVPGGAIPDWSPWRRALSRWGNRYAARALRLEVSDATSGFRVYGADVVSRLDLATVRADGYGFQIEMTYRVARHGGTIVEVPISFSDRTTGTSKMSTPIIAEALLLVTWWGVRDRVLRVNRSGRRARDRG